MTKPLGTLLVGLALVCAPACGRKGPLELPQGRAPMAVEGLAAAVRGGEVVLSWTNPAKTVSGRPLEGLRAVEIWVFEGGPPARRAEPLRRPRSRRRPGSSGGSRPPRRPPR